MKRENSLSRIIARASLPRGADGVCDRNDLIAPAARLRIPLRYERQTAPMTTYPLSATREFALHTQGLSGPARRAGRPGAADVYSAVEGVGWVQIDTLQVVRRAHYLTLWSRLGSYDPTHLDQLLFDGGCASPNNGRRLFEYWAHAACIIPLAEYRYLIPMMRRRASGRGGWHRRWATDPENRKTVDSILQRVRADGAARPADFRDGRKEPGSWWNWDSAKIALEYLYDVGELAISNRVNFQRVYDIPDRTLPSWVDRSEPTEREALLRLLEVSMRAMGVCAPAQVGDYFHMKRTESKPLVEALIADGTFVPIRAILSDRNPHDLIAHRDNLRLLERAADGDLKPRRTTFLNPFDSLFWARGRDVSFWKFQQILECYKPEPDRIWGYFCLPILDRGRLVGRFDPKLERKAGVLRLKALYLEPAVRPSARLASSVARAMRDFMRFHDARDLTIARSVPAEFGQKLMAAM